MNYGLLIYLTPKMLLELEVINNQIMRTVIHKTTNLNTTRILLKWTTIEEDLTIKMISSYARYLNLEKDHGVHQHNNMFNFWINSAKRNENYFIDTKKIIELYKQYYIKNGYYKMIVIL